MTQFSEQTLGFGKKLTLQLSHDAIIFYLREKFSAAMKTSLFFVSFSFCCCALFAQTRNPARDINRANIWHFGQQSGPQTFDAPGLLFHSGSPVVVNIGNGGTMATVSDSAGNLQITGGGYKLFNRNHVIISNGGGTIGDNILSIQHSLAVPKPDDPNLIYYFTVPNTLKYNLVDMSLDGGNGAIIEKNVTIYPSPPGVNAKIAAVHHCNGTDVWVMTHELDTDRFLAFLITGDGIDTVPVISQIGPMDNEQGSSLQGGNMIFSPNGKRLAIVYNGGIPLPQVFDFDNTTGILSNAIALQKELADQSLSFSPDNTKLYIGSNNGRLVQYNLAAGDSNDIAMSKKIIVNQLPTGYNDMQVGIDGKIYLMQKGPPNSAYLGIINIPNALDTLCNYSLQGLYLNGSFGGGAGMMKTIESYFYTGTSAYPCYGDTASVNVTLNGNLLRDVHVYPNPFSDYAFIDIVSANSIDGTIQYKLYDALGKECKVAVSELNAGNKTIKAMLHRNQIKPGIYFLTINAAEQIQATIKLFIF